MPNATKDDSEKSRSLEQAELDGTLIQTGRCGRLLLSSQTRGLHGGEEDGAFALITGDNPLRKTWWILRTQNLLLFLTPFGIYSYSQGKYPALTYHQILLQ
jgi:hypothetical protein